MSGAEPAPRLTQRERDDAMRLLDTALAEGQLDSDEHLARVTQVLEATQPAHVERALYDLQQPTPTRRERLRAVWAQTSRRERVMVPVGLGVFLAVTGLAIVLPGSNSADELAYAAIAEQDPTSVKRISAFTDAYEEEFGTTRTGGVQLDEAEAQVHVPTEGAARRYETWYLQSDAFNHYGSVSSGDAQVDLAAIDEAAAARNLDLAWSHLGVEDPTHITIIISGPDSAADPAEITYIVRNEFEESGQLATDLDGEELSRDPFEPPASDR
jgi:hypothetical protein